MECHQLPLGRGSNLKGMFCWGNMNIDQVMLQGTAYSL